ncbi:MAG: IPT/TIG domain-containing protein, partial [Solirubrobacteraceae bacterium]
MTNRRLLSRTITIGALPLVVTCLLALLVPLAGVADAQGVAGYQLPSQTFTVSGVGSSTQTVSCSAGNVVMSGGFSVSAASVQIVASTPSGSTGWTVTANNNGRTAQTFTITAVCVSSSSATGYAQATNTQSVPQNSQTADIAAPCASGSVVVGGGYAAPDRNILVYHSAPIVRGTVVPNAWDGFVLNQNSSAAESVTVTAVCVSSSLSGYEEQQNQTTLNASSTGSVTASCSKTGNLVLGGSFVVETPTVVLTTAAQPSSQSAWTLAATNTDASNSRLISTIAICAAPAPTVTAINPTSGPARGGTTVSTTGTNFTGATAVMFGTTAATAFTVNSATSITATSPAGTGTVDITVTTPNGTTATSVADQFAYIPPPT